MKKWIILFGLLATTWTAYGLENQQDNKSYVNFSHCTSFGQGVPFSFQHCLNNNFSTASRSLSRTFFSYCSNSGDEVQFFFVNCVNQNFSRIERVLDYQVNLQYCTNPNRERIEFYFTSCVNNNFSKIARYINNRDPNQ
jgi:hypothetical protein